MSNLANVWLAGRIAENGRLVPISWDAVTAHARRTTICYLADAPSTHTQRWATHFSALGFKVHVISFRPAAIAGVAVHHLAPVRGRGLGYVLTVPRIRQLLRVIRPDVVHAHYATSYGLVGALAGARPLIVTAWGSDVLIAPRRSVLMRGIVTAVLHRADLVTSMAHHMTKSLVELGVPAAKIMTLPFGVNTSIFHPPDSNTPSRDIEVICTRALEPIYNIALLIRALPAVAAQHPTIRCVLAGDGSQRRALEALARRVKVADRILWIGRVSLSEVAAWLRRAWVFVTPALSDGNNISLNEAMACGCFPVASDIPANREWLTDGTNGFVVPSDRADVLAQRILQALSSAELRQRAAERNWQIVQERADWHRNIAAMEVHYRQLTGQYAG